MKLSIKKLLSAFVIIALFVQGIAAGDGEGKTLVVAMSATDMTLDPLHSYRTDELQVATGIYEGLVTYNPENLRPIPGVAYKWEISEDGKTYTFFLRDRARFSNGDPVTATDFRDSWLRIIDPDEEGEYSFLFDVIKGSAGYRKGENRDPQSVGIRVSGDSLLVVELERPASHFLSMLAHMSFSPIHKQYRTGSGWEHRAPLISNGPFVLESWSGGDLVLKRNLNYWDKWHVPLDAVEIITVANPGEAARLLNDGTVHWADYADTGAIQNPALLQVGPLFATSYLYFRTEVEPWSNPLVRRGISLLIPWNQLRSNASAFISTTLVPSVGFYDAPKGLTEKNVEAGLELLAEAGYPSGRGLPDMRIVVTPGSVAQAVVEEAAEIWEERLGISVDIVPVNYNQYTEIARSGGYVLGASTWIGDFADPLSFLQMWTTGSKLNDAAYSSSRYDELIEKAMSLNDETRFDVLAQAEEILLSGEVVVIPLANPPSFNLVDLERVSGWYSNALDIHPFKYMGFKKPNVPDWYVSVPDSLVTPILWRRPLESY